MGNEDWAPLFFCAELHNSHVRKIPLAALQEKSFTMGGMQAFKIFNHSNLAELDSPIEDTPCFISLASLYADLTV